MLPYWIKGQKNTGVAWSVSNIDTQVDTAWSISSNENLIDLGIPK